MCVGFWSLNHPEYALVLCTNRDEYLDRPTDHAHWHSFDGLRISPAGALESKPISPEVELGHQDSENTRGGTVLSGIDILAGGTWFGISKYGEVALLTNIARTNITEPAVKLPSSRGHLCSSFLLRPPSQLSKTVILSDFVEDLVKSDIRYAGFNMLLLAPRRAYSGEDIGGQARKYEFDAAFISNGGAGNPVVSVPLPLSGSPHACGGISNGISTGRDPFTGVRSPSGLEWSKVKQGKDLLEAALAESDSAGEGEGGGEDRLVEKLFDLLRTKTHSPPKTRQEFQETIFIDPVAMSRLRNEPSFQPAPRPDQAQGSDHSTVPDEKSPSVFRSSSPEFAFSKKKPTPDEGSQLKNYATRLSSVLLVRKDGSVLFVERDTWVAGRDGTPVLATMERNEGSDHHERRFDFQLE